MADTAIAAGDVKAVERWSDQLMRETFGKMSIRGLIGRSNDSCIKLLTDLDKDAGDRIRFDLRVQDRSGGVSGDDRLSGGTHADSPGTGAESEMIFHQDDVYVNQKRNAHVFGSMTQQRTVHDLRKEARSSMSDWASWVFEAGLLAHLAGTTGDGVESAEAPLYETTTGNPTAGTDVFGNDIVVMDAGHKVSTSGGAMGMQWVEDAVAKAKVNNPRVAPCNIDGEMKYILLVHPYAARSIRTEIDSVSHPGWIDSQRRAGARGEANPIWTGALGEYNGCVIVENEFIPYTTTGTLCSNLLLGACAGAIGFGNAWNRLSSVRANGGGSYFGYIENNDDYDNLTGIGTAMITGFKRSIFNSLAFGAILVESTDAPPA